MASGQTIYRTVLDNKNEYVKYIVWTEADKKVKSELTQAISTVLNAISAQNTEHLNDKLEKLTLLLAGRPVVLREAQVCASYHPHGLRYCKALLAKKIVRQGEDVVSSKAESAFPVAAVALALWEHFPDFGDLLLAYFYEFTPLLAPFLPARTEGQSDQEYRTLIGYKYEKDTPEKQDQFLKRMSGLARLFSAIAASHRSQGGSQTHPLGPKKVWSYLAMLVNLEPVADLTATLLFVVLENTGNMMLNQYRAQFYKLLVFLKESFLPRLEAVKTDGGPTSRLEIFLNKAIAEKRIEAPKGNLSAGFLKQITLPAPS